MSANSITLKLSDSVYQRARRAATLLNRSIEDVLESTLNTTLPEVDDAPSDLAADLAELPTLSDVDLWHVARRQMKAEREVLLHDLLDEQAERPLTLEEAHQLEELRHEAGRLMLLKSQAYALLHQRGYPVPQP
jgi:hypothetical protein